MKRIKGREIYNCKQHCKKKKKLARASYKNRMLTSRYSGWVCELKKMRKKVPVEGWEHQKWELNGNEKFGAGQE